MKRILTATFATILVLAMCIIPASASDSYTLLPADGEWTTVAGPDGSDITVNVTEEATVFSASASWPCANCHYTKDQIVKASIDDYSLVYDLTVETGATNINFTFTDGFGNSAGYSISNTTLGDINYDAGSGDLNAGEYKGAVKLSDLINSTMYFGGTAFPKNIIGENNELIFTDIQVYSVSGATVTIRQLALVPNDEADIPVGETSTEESVPDESEEISEESVEESKEESKTESKEESKAESKEESKAESTTEESSEGEENEGGGISPVVIAIIAAAVVVVIVVIVIVIKKKK